MHDQTAAITAKPLADELEQLWNERLRTLYRRLTRSYPREFMKLLDSVIDSFVPKFTNATRMLKQQLSAEGVSVRVSAGCLAEFARIASAAAARTRPADEPYGSCLRREIVAPCRFIREWTSTDKKFDETQWGEFVSIARKYALPRPWIVSEAVASVRGYASVAAQIPTPGALKTV
jgi:hypothetical protein